MTYSAILDCQDIYFALSIFCPSGQAGACRGAGPSAVGLSGEETGKRSDVNE